MIKFTLQNGKAVRLGRIAASIAIVTLLLGVVLFGAQQVYAYVNGISMSGVSADCTQVTLVVDDVGVGSGTRTGTFTFAGSVGIPVLPVSCPTNCNDVDDTVVLDLNGGGGYNSATPVTINWTYTNGSPGVGAPGFASGTPETATGSFTLPACGSGSSGGGTTTTASAAPLPPLDPPGTAPRVYGGYDNPGSEVVVYQQSSTNYQVYSYSGVPIGQVSLGTVGIPGAGGLITTLSNGQFRVELFYDGGDYVRIKMYINGQLVEDGRFVVSGIGARAGTAPGGGSASVASVSSGGTVTVICSQKLRLEPNTGAATLDVLQPGAVLTVVARSNDATWLNVTTPDGLTGWTYNGRCVNVNTSGLNNAPIVVNLGLPTVGEQLAAPPANAQGPIQVNVPPGTPVIGMSCGQNMRSGPATSYPVVRVIPAGSTLQVVGRSTDMFWVQVSAGTVNGWTTLGSGCSQMVDGDITAVPVMVQTGG